jgi:predicted negative regulator of RcsB-dependent stress response
MAAYDLEEQEQLSAMKAWWEKHGNLVSWLATAVAVVVLGVQGWRWYQANQAAEAGAIYASVLQSVEKSDPAKSRMFAGNLVSKFPGLVAADLGALLASKAEVDAGDLKGAALKLQWVIDNSKDPALRDMARLRMAVVQIEQKSFDEALKTLQPAPETPFVTRFEDLRGDAYWAKGANKEAAAAYKRAIEAYDKSSDNATGAAFKNAIETKLEALGEV